MGSRMASVVSVIHQENQKGQLMLALLVEALIVVLCVSGQLIQ